MPGLKKNGFVRGAVLFTALFFIFSGKLAAQEASKVVRPNVKPENIYITDFLLNDQAKVREDNTGGGPLKSLRPGLIIPKKDPVVKAQELIQLLSDSLVKDLNKKGINATRLSSADTLPPEGWIIRGEFLEFQEGDQAQQAVIGLGKGSAKMQARIEVSELGKAGNTPFLIFGSNTSSALRPGAGAMAAINPYAAAAKFVLSKDPSDKEIKKIAAEVASNIEEYLEQIGS